MRTSYNKLWKLLIDRNMNKSDLRKISGISTTSVAKMGKGKSITTDVIVKVCKALNCNVEDMMEVIADEEDEVEKEK